MHISYKNTGVRISEQVYEPSEDSFLLAEAALYEIENSEKILEVGCGCGIISAVIEANTEAKVIGIDINPFAAVCSKQNGIEVIRGDLLNCIRGKFDIIIFNPPYLPTGDRERTGDWLAASLDGGNDGRRVINSSLYFLQRNPKYLFLQICQCLSCDPIYLPPLILCFSFSERILLYLKSSF